MPEYRAYNVGTDGHFTSFEVIVALDDGQPIKIAEKLTDLHDGELWQIGRQIAVIQKQDLPR